jgi:hypothetical protein
MCFYWQKLQKSEQEDIAGNYFKPKRAVELLNRAKEDASRAFSTWKGKYLSFGHASEKCMLFCIILIFTFVNCCMYIILMGEVWNKK